MRYNNMTSRLYQSGIDRDKAKKLGADLLLFDSLELEFKGSSIPVHLLHGFIKSEPYSCKYHTGGTEGERLREIIASQRD